MRCSAGPTLALVGGWWAALLVLVCACGGNPAGLDPPAGLTVITTTDGVSPDSDGYTVTVQRADFGRTAPIVDRTGINDTLHVAIPDPGVYSVTITDVRFTCTVTRADPPLANLIWVNTTVSATQTTFVRFHFTCRPPPTGRLVFVGPGGLTTINGDGSGLMLLSTDSLYKADPAWSPDGTRIAWVHGDAIEVMNADGSGRITLAHGRSPSWSPDGTRLVFSSGGQLYTMRSDGSGVTQLTNGFSNALYPAWCPTSDRIAFSGYRDGIQGIYLIRPDGSDPSDLYFIAVDGTQEGRFIHGWDPDWTR